ncbi:MAG: hypothetical protein ACI8P9_005128, partial [Parasphingorhabdus sp.]
MLSKILNKLNFFRSANHLKPNHLEKYYIYDIFHSDDNKIIIVMPAETEPLEIKYLQADKASMTNFDLYKCPHNHTYIYSLNVDYTKNITLKINNEIVETYVNKYPSFENEIIFSTLVKF